MLSSGKHPRLGIRHRAGQTCVLCAALLLLSTVAGCGQNGDQPGAQQGAGRPATGTTQEVEGTTVAATTNDGNPDRGPETRPVTITGTIDGDTVVIEPAIDGHTDLRLLGVDTPELDSSEPLAEKAADFTERELEGERVELILGEESVDPYGRLLGTIMPEGQQTTHGQVLLRRGYAQTLFYEPSTQYQMLYRATQEDAKERGAGMWSLPIEERCELADHGNGIGASSPECEGIGSGTMQLIKGGESGPLRKGEDVLVEDRKARVICSSFTTLHHSRLPGARLRGLWSG